MCIYSTEHSTLCIDRNINYIRSSRLTKLLLFKKQIPAKIQCVIPSLPSASGLCYEVLIMERFFLDKAENIWGMYNCRNSQTNTIIEGTTIMEGVDST